MGLGGSYRKSPAKSVSSNNQIRFMKDELSTTERLAVSNPNQNNRSPNNLLEFHNGCPEHVFFPLISTRFNY